MTVLHLGVDEKAAAFGFRHVEVSVDVAEAVVDRATANEGRERGVPPMSVAWEMAEREEERRKYEERRRVVDHLAFVIPHLAHRQLSSNGPHGHWSKDSAGRAEMRAFTAQALPSELPSWEAVEVSFNYWTVRAREGLSCCAPRRFKAEKCPTCLQRFFDGTLGAASTCQCYRATDNFNLFPVAKPIVDALVDAGIIPDDKHEEATVGLVRIRHCDSIEDERIEVFVRPVEAAQEAA